MDNRLTTHTVRPRIHFINSFNHKVANRDFYQGIYKTAEVSFKEVYPQFINANTENMYVSWGTFFFFFN